MKLKELMRHLERHGCRFVRQGGNHSIYINVTSGKMTSIPRHREVKKGLVRKICDDLGIDRPTTK